MITRGDFFDGDNAKMAPADAMRGVRNEGEKPHRGIKSMLLGELVTTGCRHMAVRADCGRMAPPAGCRSEMLGLSMSLSIKST